jgi:hypothetical protein
VVETTMDLEGWVRKRLEEASPDLLRATVQDYPRGVVSSKTEGDVTARRAAPGRDGRAPRLQRFTARRSPRRATRR